jgi:excisionase family DNA binding protein
MSDNERMIALTNNTDRLLLRGAEVAEILGCSRALVYRLMARAELPVVRISPNGTAVRIPRAALLEWIRVNTQAPTVTEVTEKLS